MSLTQVARDFGIHEMMLQKWLCKADVEEGVKPGVTSAPSPVPTRIRGSMGQVGSADDNAMESFYSLLQHNVLNRQRWSTRDELRIAIVSWIERTYPRRRRQPQLGRLTPIEFETIMTKPPNQAA